MSRKKIHVELNIDDCLDRFKSALAIKSDADIAKLLDISTQNLSNKKKGGTLIVDLLEFAINSKMNINWLLFGDDYEKARSEDKIINAMQNDPYKDLITKTRTVLESKTGYSSSLAMNIESFHESVVTLEKVENLEKDVKELKSTVDKLSANGREKEEISVAQNAGN